MAAKLDPRRDPYRADLAAEHLKDRVHAPRYATAQRMQVTAPVLDVLASPQSSELVTQLLYGETIDVYEMSADLAWGQSISDGYVGYFARSGLGQPHGATMRITAIKSHVYPEPNFKTRPTMDLPFLAQLDVLEQSGAFAQTRSGFVPLQHLARVQEPLSNDFLGQAMRFLGTPYLWGGRSANGIDCSALVQLALMATGRDCPRDSDMQCAELGKTLRKGSSVEPGDLFFWKGHVAIASDETTLIHANAHHMAVRLEALDDAIGRIGKTDGPVLAHKRIS